MSETDTAIITAPEADETAVVATQPNAGNKARATWPISTSALRANLSHNSEEAAEAMVDAFLFCIQENITRPEFAEQVDELGKKLHGAQWKFTDNWVYQVIRGSYRAEKKDGKEGARLPISPDKLKAILMWVNERRAHLAEAMREKDFVLTPTAQRVIMAVKLARESRTPVFLYGPSHIGKTWALQYASKTMNHGRTLYCRMKAASGLHGLIDSLCAACGQSPKVSTAKKINGLYGACRGNMALILDEIQLLLHTYRRESFFACMEFIREFYDRSGIGLVLSMNNVGRDKIQAERKVELEQLFRRGVHEVQLPDAPTVEDVRLVLEHNFLKLPAEDYTVTVRDVVETPYEVLRQLAADKGMKSICERVRYGRKLAAEEKRRVTWADVMRAHLTLKANSTAPATGWN